MTTKENRILRLLDILTEHERKVEDIEEKIWQLQIKKPDYTQKNDPGKILFDILTEHERKIEDIEEKIWQLRIEGNGFIILSQDEIIFNEP